MNPDPTCDSLDEARQRMGHLHASLKATLQRLLVLLEADGCVVGIRGLRGHVSPQSRAAESRQLRAAHGCVVRCGTTKGTRYCPPCAFWVCPKHWPVHQRLAHTEEERG